MRKYSETQLRKILPEKFNVDKYLFETLLTIDFEIIENKRQGLMSIMKKGNILLDTYYCIAGMTVNETEYFSYLIKVNDIVKEQLLPELAKEVNCYAFPHYYAISDGILGNAKSLK